MSDTMLELKLKEGRKHPFMPLASGCPRGAAVAREGCIDFALA
jgi:hypothetical protein